MNFDKIDKILSGEPKFRSKQVKQLIWRDLIESWDEATTLPIELRKKLTEECPLEIKAEVFPDKDGRSVKALISLEDGLNVETVLMRHKKDAVLRVPRGAPLAGRNTVCVSSQIGCPLGCIFCATGKMGFKRNLTAGEITEQVLWWARWLDHGLRALETDNADNVIHPTPTLPLAGEGKNRVNNVVFMGMGEPFLNYNSVSEAIKILNDDNLLGIGARHISVSTAGIVEGMEKMVEDMPQINLAISLHAPSDKLRQELMPIAKKYPLAQLMAGAADYVERTNRKLMFEYIMIKGVNDSPGQARELIKLMDNRLYFVNLIVYNKTGELIPSPAGQVKNFKDLLMKAGVQTLERYRFGQEIKGACGQLVAKNTKE